MSHTFSINIENQFKLAEESTRKRSNITIHNKGDYVNKVYNFILQDSYMQPHLHPGHNKIEEIECVEGKLVIVYFTEDGKIKNYELCEVGIKIKVPAFKWHTYVMLSEKVITYETMDTVYHPATWKVMAPWAPKEESREAQSYLQKIRNGYVNLKDG